ncbi:glycosyltransferase family 1 protein, partial [Candidatus Woesearchaeota archaeon]|nr:glycosyltransferase family 1 protein [Candidatus Woesearchaeota archaeon]
MPTSSPHQINEIMGEIMELDPSSILDIGVGFGKYGFLCREYLELWDYNNKRYGEWKREIDGIEVYEDYITDIQRKVYNNIFIGD